MKQTTSHPYRDREWSETDLFDLHNHLACGATVAETADALMRSKEEVLAKIEELGLVVDDMPEHDEMGVEPEPRVIS